jgi:hypothetical protein
MKRPTLSVVLLLVAAAYAALAQSPPGPDLVPPRIHVSQNGPASADAARELASAADTLFAAVAARTPVVRVDDPAQAQARIEVTVTAQAGGYRVAAALIAGGRAAATRETQVAPGAAGFQEYVTFVTDTAAAFAPLLPMIEPQVVLGDAAQEARYRDVAQATDFAARLASDWELTFWAGGLSELYHEPVQQRDGQLDIRAMFALPVWADAAWYYSRNSGLVASLFFDYGDFVGLGTVYSGDIRVDKADATALLALPGVGITYRTLAQISAQFATTLYFGPAWVSARDDIRGIAKAGEDAWTYYFMMSLTSALCWNVTTHFSVKMRVAVNLDIMSTFLSDVSNRETYSPVMLQFFTVGAAWRP